tara:strand:- start:191 stop:724 length:534 start_codon:yes stop_codon:yes gene_type:complete
MFNKGVIFDRDGTLIEHIDYLGNSKKVKIVKPIKKILKKMKLNGFYFFIQTNQSGVERGFYTKNDVYNCNDRMIFLLDAQNIFDDICISYKIDPNNCRNRKPNPDFGLHVMNKYKIRKENLYFIGDNNVDIETAINIGCNPIHVNSGKVKKNDIIYDKVIFLNDVEKALQYIMKLYQ